jgi:hypothetical protein
VNAARRVDAPGDITASELYEVLLVALERCGHGESSLSKAVSDSAKARKGFLLGLLATCVSVMRERGWSVVPPSAAQQAATLAALDTTMQAREGRVCGAQSLLPGRLGVYCYCTLKLGHDGVAHVAKATSGEIVATWPVHHNPIDPR